ncbi:MAG TPA: hypothetical protein VJ725_27035 [Thermoanaerobaculia bacterium]|nr:hypothetical protein [Thermoanaerobaculia bacterium]
MDEPENFRVPAAPNESVVRGRVVRIRPTPEGLGAIWDVELKEAEEVENLANLARSRVGETVSIYIHPDLKVKIRVEDFIEARILFQGDERGGAFFLKGQDVRPLKR